MPFIIFISKSQLYTAVSKKLVIKVTALIVINIHLYIFMSDIHNGHSALKTKLTKYKFQTEFSGYRQISHDREQELKHVTIRK